LKGLENGDKSENFGGGFCDSGFCCNSLRATIITINLTAEVTQVDDISGLLEGNVNVGDTITGSYTYDSTTPDSNPSETVGDYRYFSAPYGVTLSAGGFVFKTDPSSVYFCVEVGNNHLYQTWDHYLFRSYNNLTLSNGVLVDVIDWQLYDDSGTALLSDELPTTPPILEQWQSYVYGLRITYGDRGYSSISADVTSAVPEPGTVFLLGLGCLVLSRKRKFAAVRS